MGAILVLWQRWAGRGGKSILSQQIPIMNLAGSTGVSAPHLGEVSGRATPSTADIQMGSRTWAELHPAILPSRPRSPSGVWLRWSP